MSQELSTIGLIGEKCGMTQVFDEDGQAIAVTVLELQPLVVTQVKTQDTDGYAAVQVGYIDGKEKHVNKPQQGIFKKNNIALKRKLKEFRLTSSAVANYSVGQEIDIASLFKAGDAIKVTGTSIGKGFQGATKLHHFGRGPMSHGSKSHRLPGSIGAGTTPGRVRKGLSMAANMGNETVTVTGLKVVNVLNVDLNGEQKQLLLVSGAVPGKPGSLLTVLPFVPVGQKVS